MSYFVDRRSEVRAFFLAWIPLLTLFVFSVCGVFYRRRALLPIAARPVWTTLAGFMLDWIYILTACLRYVWFDDHPCLLHFFGNWPAILALNCYVVRIWVHWFNFKLTEEKSKLSASLEPSLSSQDSDTGGWFLKHQYLVSDKYLLAFFLIKSIPEGVLLYTPLAYVEGSTSDYFYVGLNEFRTTCRTINAVQALLVVGLMLEIGFICIVAAFKYGEVRDNFYLKEEFRTIGWITVVVTVIWIATRFIDGGELGPSNYPWVDLSGTLIPTVTKLIMIFVSGAVPIWKTFTTKQNVTLLPSSSELLSKPSASTGQLPSFFLPYYDSMNDVLGTASGRADFKIHLKLEFSVENLLFWEAIESFRREFNPEDPAHNKRLALTVAKRFVTDYAPLEVNIDWPTRAELVRSVGLKMADDASASPSFSPFKGSGVFAIQEDEEEDAVTSKDGRGRVRDASSRNSSSHRSGSRSVKARKSGELDVVPVTLFDRAQRKVVALMASDSFVRFKKKRRDSLSQVQLSDAVKRLSMSQAPATGDLNRTRDRPAVVNPGEQLRKSSPSPAASHDGEGSAATRQSELESGPLRSAPAPNSSLSELSELSTISAHEPNSRSHRADAERDSSVSRSPGRQNTALRKMEQSTSHSCTANASRGHSRTRGQHGTASLHGEHSNGHAWQDTANRRRNISRSHSVTASRRQDHSRSASRGLLDDTNSVQINDSVNSDNNAAEAGDVDAE